MRAHQHAQAKPHVGHAAGHRALHVHQLHGHQTVLGRDEAGIGHPARRGADRGDAAGRGRLAQRAADVVAETDRTHAAGERSRLAAARAAGRAPGMPGISRQPMQRTRGVNAQRHVRQIGAGDRYRAGGAHSLDNRRVDRHHGLRQRRHAPRRGQAGHVDVLLHREGHPVQGANAVAGGHLAIRRDRRGAGSVLEHLHDRVQRRIDGIDPCQMRLHHLR